MTTYYPFVPSSQGAFNFNPVLDGNSYVCTVTWNLFGQRYYLNCFDANNLVVFSVPLVTTQASKVLSSLSWNAANLLATATALLPHGMKIGTVAPLTIAGANPGGFNGVYACNVLSPTTFSYPLANNPGNLISPGSASFLVSLSAGYFESTIVFRSNQFEVSP